MTEAQKPTQIPVSNPDAEKKRKEKLQAAFKKFIVQIKTGCDKQICFNQFCKKNIFRKCLCSGSDSTPIGSGDYTFAND